MSHLCTDFVYWQVCRLQQMLGFLDAKILNIIAYALHRAVGLLSFDAAVTLLLSVAICLSTRAREKVK